MFAGITGVNEGFFESSGGVSEELDYRRLSDADVQAGISAYSGTGMAATPAALRERMDILLFRTKTLGKYWSYGVSLVEVTGENKRRFFMVEKVTSGSPADVSHVLVGDVVIAVNGKDTAGLPMAEVRRRIQDSGDQLILTVLSSSPFRLLGTRRDVNEIIKAAGQETIQLRVLKTSCGGSGNYGFTTLESKAWNEVKMAFVRCHLIHTIEGAQVVTLNKCIFPGDLLLMINGATVENMDQNSVKAALCKGGNEISITIAPMSPLRIKRPAYIRGHETVPAVDNAP